MATRSRRGAAAEPAKDAAKSGPSKKAKTEPKAETESESGPVRSLRSYQIVSALWQLARFA